MAYQEFDDDDGSGLSDREMPDESDMDDRDSIDTEPCPHCGLPVYEKAEQCPYCKLYISREETSEGRSGWIVAGIVICVALILLSWILLR